MVNCFWTRTHHYRRDIIEIKLFLLDLIGLKYNHEQGIHAMHYITRSFFFSNHNDTSFLIRADCKRFTFASSISFSQEAIHFYLNEV